MKYDVIFSLPFIAKNSCYFICNYYSFSTQRFLVCYTLSFLKSVSLTVNMYIYCKYYFSSEAVTKSNMPLKTELGNYSRKMAIIL